MGTVSICTVNTILVPGALPEMERVFSWQPSTMRAAPPTPEQVSTRHSTTDTLSPTRVYRLLLSTIAFLVCKSMKMKTITTTTTTTITTTITTTMVTTTTTTTTATIKTRTWKLLKSANSRMNQLPNVKPIWVN